LYVGEPPAKLALLLLEVRVLSIDGDELMLTRLVLLEQLEALQLRHAHLGVDLGALGTQRRGERTHVLRLLELVHLYTRGRHTHARRG
jgi:hypothetical protein